MSPLIFRVVIPIDGIFFENYPRLERSTITLSSRGKGINLLMTVPTHKTRQVNSTRRSKYWCITINNPGWDPEDYWLEETMLYLVVGKEKGKSGTTHYQVFCSYKGRLSMNQVSKDFPKAHIEGMYSTPLAASVYCKKDQDFEEFGELPVSQAKTASADMKQRWTDAIAMAKGFKLDQMADEMPSWYVRYYHAWKKIQQDNPPDVKSLSGPCGVWISGPAGCGKSFSARRDYSPLYDKPLNKWWDGYKGEPNILLDDVDSNQATWIPYFLKRWADEYPFPAEHKGTTTKIRPNRIVVTSQWKMEDLFIGRNLAAIQRRFVSIELGPREMAPDTQVI